MNTFERIYENVKRIPRGKVATYGMIAAMSGNPRLARVVGYALHVNPEPGARSPSSSNSPWQAGTNTVSLIIVMVGAGLVGLVGYQWLPL